MYNNSDHKVQPESLLNNVLTRLDGVQKTSSGHIACCPAHDDHDPSLSVKEEDGKVLLNCHAGCDTEEVVDALGLEMADLFAEDVDSSWKPWEGTEVAVYTYTDADGNPLFQVVRYEMHDQAHPAYGEKRFLQRRYAPDHPEAGKKCCPDGYVWGLKDIQRVLFNLPEVLLAIEEGDFVWFVEGEKDARTLQHKGLPATCNPGGASKGDDPGRKFTPDMAEPLEGADVVIVPDKDETGLQFAESVAKRVHPKVDRVQILELSDVPKGGDVTDYLENGHSVDELRELASETEPFEPPPETVDELIERAREKGNPAYVYEHIRVLAEAPEADYQQARGRLKEATGINLNGLESARQEVIDQIDEEEREQEWEGLDAEELPVIRLGDDRPSREIVREAVEAYEEFNDPPWQFSRGEEPVRVNTNEEGHPVFKSVGEALFDALLSESANFVRATENGVAYVDPPLRLVRRVRQLVDLPLVTGIQELPFLRPDGTVVRTPGYDPETRIFYRPHPKVEVPEIPEVPSRSDLGLALGLLKEPFCDFPFVDEASRANLLATAFTPIVKPLLDGANVPLVIFDATKQGTGKTLLADVVALMGMGRVPATMNAPSSDEEWRKQITAQLRKGEPIIVVDNVKGRISSSALERALTARSCGDRLLGHSKQLKLPADALWIATGNNLRPRGEMTRRCILVQMDAEMVQPWKRTGFEHPNLRDWVRSNRGRLVAALLTVVRSWIDEGCPTPEIDTLGSFEQWAKVVGGVLGHLGIEGFLDNIDELYETASSEGHMWSQLLQAIHEWSLDDGDPTPFTTKEIDDELRKHAERHIEADTEELRAIRDNLPEDLQERLRYGESLARSLGKTFEYREGRRFPGGWYLERVTRDRDGVHWIVRRDDTGDSA
jgi:hypothetical protein